MNILYCGDKNIGDGLVISIMSLLKCVKEPLKVYVLTIDYALCEPLPQSLTDRLHDLVQASDSEGFVQRLDITSLFTKEPPIANMDTRFTPCCMLRLYADQVPELPERLLYLDNDVICRLNPEEFYYQDLQGCEIAGVLDYYGKWFFRRKLFRMDYLNSGVLLLDLERIRRTGLFQKCRKRCQNRKMFMPDQSAINKLAQSRKNCPRCYNEQRKLHQNTVFQHFTTSFRFFPWFHTVSVKPWQVDRVQNVLKIHEYDLLLEEYSRWKADFQ